MRPRRIAPISWTALAVLCLSMGAFGSVAAQTATQGGANQAPSLSSARQSLAKKAGTEGFAGLLESSALSLAPREALILLGEFIPKASEASRSSLYALQASLALIMGEYLQAASALQKAFPGQPEQLLKASRCYLAGGETAQAETLIASIPDARDGRSFAEAKSLVSAWSAILSGRTERAWVLLEALAKSKNLSAERREALFLLWMLSASGDGQTSIGAAAPSAYLAQLRADFPASLEYAAAQASLSLKPAAWLLNTLHSPSSESPARVLSTKAPEPKGEPEGAKARAELQVGWFSREENAKALRATLASKGFDAYTEEGISSQGDRRWAVLVRTGENWIQTQAQLKDLGYESYLLSVQQ